MPSNPAINPFNYNIDNFDSGFLGPISDTNFRTYLFTHNLGTPNSVISGVISNPWSDRGTEYNVSQSTFNVTDVPNLQTVATTPSVFNNLTNPRQVNIGSNLPNINPQVQANIGQTTPIQAGQGIDSATQIATTSSNIDVPGLQTVANTPSVYNNLTNPRQVNLAGNLQQLDPAIQANIGQSTPIQAGQGIDATLLFNTNVANIDVPSPTIVANTPSLYNNLTNPRQDSLSNNLQQLDPAVQANLGLNTPIQAGLGQDVTSSFNTNVANLDLPSVQVAASTPSNINDFTNPRQDNLDMNATLNELVTWYPQEFDVVLAANSNDYNTSYGVPQTLKIGFVGNIDSWVEPSGVVTPSLLYSLQNILVQSNNKYGPPSLNTQTWVNNGLDEITLVSETGFVGYESNATGPLGDLLGQANDFLNQLTGISLANPNQLGVGIIPFSDIGSGINFRPGGEKSDLEKIGARRRATEIANRVISNAVDDTIGRFTFLERPFAALAGGPNKNFNIFEKNYIITSRKGSTGEILQAASSLVGLNAIGTNFFTGPDFADGAFNGTNDIGPSFGDNLASTSSWDISENLLDRTGDNTKSLLFDSLSRNKYGPRTQKAQGTANTDINSPYKRKKQVNYLTYNNGLDLSEDVNTAIENIGEGDTPNRKLRRKLNKAQKEIDKKEAKDTAAGIPTEFTQPTANQTPAYGGFIGNNQPRVIDELTYSDNAGFVPVLDTNEITQKPSTTWQGDNPNQKYPRDQTTHEGFDWRYRNPSGFKKGLLQYTQFIVNQAATDSDNYIPSGNAKLSPQKMVQNPAGLVGYFDSDVSFKRKSRTETTTKTVVKVPAKSFSPIGAGAYGPPPAGSTISDGTDGKPIGTITIPEVTETTTETKVIYEDADPENSAHLTGVESLGSWPTLPSKGNQVRNVTIKTTKDKLGNKKFSGVEGGDVYCRSWTSRRKYHKDSNLIRGEGNWWKIPKGNESIMTMNYPSQQNGRPKIAWDKYDSDQFKNINPGQELNKIKGLVIPYMFSIENLAWKDAPQKLELPPCELGPNEGRIMWFPPYNMEFSDNTSVNWDKTDFIGRGEAIYAYNNTERSGNLSWTIVVDHPEVLNNMRDIFKSTLSSIVADGTINSFFAGCTSLKELFEPLIVPDKVIPEKPPCVDCDLKVEDPKDPPFDEFRVYFENAVKCGVVEEQKFATKAGVKQDYSAPDPKTKKCKTAGGCIGRVIDWEYENTKIVIGGYFAGTPMDACSNASVLDSPNKEVGNTRAPIPYSAYTSAYYFDPSNPLSNFQFGNVISDPVGFTENILKASPILRITGLNSASGISYMNLYNSEDLLVKALNKQVQDERNSPDYIIRTGKDALRELAEFLVTADGKNYEIHVDGYTSASQSDNPTTQCQEQGGTLTFNDILAKHRAQSLMVELYDLMVQIEGDNPVKEYGIAYPKETQLWNVCDDETEDPFTDEETGEIVVEAKSKLHNDRWQRYNVGSNEEPEGCKNESCCSKTCCDRDGKPCYTAKTMPNDNIFLGKNFWKDEKTHDSVGNCLTNRCYEGNPCYRGLQNAQANSLFSKEARRAAITLVPNTSRREAILKQINTENRKKADEEYKETLKKAEADYQKLIGDITTKYINECDYFLKMEKDAPFIYNSLVDKIQNFHPAFHAITPEGFNKRLTFLQQCTRQGPQMINEDLPNNMVFGRPPVCVLRIGDFYHTKIIIESVNFSFDPLQWDLNPEGIGVQPMLVKVDMSFKFIGGSSLGGPIQQLQNAVTYNFFANTGIYNPLKEVKNSMDNRKKIFYGAFLTPEEELEAYKAQEPTATEAEAEKNESLKNVNATETKKAEASNAEKEKVSEEADKSIPKGDKTGQPDNKAATNSKPTNTGLLPMDYGDKYVFTDCDELHAFQETTRSGQKITIGNMNILVKNKLEELWRNGAKPIITDVNIKVSKNNNELEWIVKIEESKDGRAWLGFTSRGSGCCTKDNVQPCIDGGKADLKSMDSIKSSVIATLNEPNTEIKLVKLVTNKKEASNLSFPGFAQYFYAYTKPEWEKANPQTK